MSDLIRSSSSWWAPTSKHARRSALGTTAIVLVLALITWLVWVSPSSPVSKAVHHALGVATSADRAAKTGEIKAKLVDARRQIGKLEGQLQTSSAQSSARADQLASLKAEIASLQKQLGTVNSKLAAAQAKSGSAGTSGSSSGSGTASSSGSGSDTASSSGGTSGSGGSAVTGNGGKSTDTTTAAITTPTKAQIMAQTSRWYGLYTTQAPFNWAEYDDVSQKVGKATNMVGYFQGFDKDFDSNAVQRAWSNGRLPVMTWETVPSNTSNDEKYVPGYTNADIINHKFDSYLTKYAQAIKANGMPMVIRLDHEMNGNWYSWSDGEKQQNAEGSYVQMWKTVWNIFQQNGANNYVIWDWSPTRVNRLGDALGADGNKLTTEAHTKSYWPGASYVDWVGMSGYYRNADEDPTFEETYGDTLAQIRNIAPGKKILLGEVGATETGTSATDGQKAAWFTSFFKALADPANSDINGFVYFNETATTIVDGTRVTNDWRINSRADSLAAFKAGIARSDIDYDLEEVKQ